MCLRSPVPINKGILLFASGRRLDLNLSSTASLCFPQEHEAKHKNQGATNRVDLGDVAVTIFRNVGYYSLDMTKADGLCLWVSFDQPHHLATKTKKELEEFW